MGYYKAKSGSSYSDKTANIIGEYLQKNYGSIKPETRKLLADIKADKNHFLRKFIEWNKDKGFENWQLFQIRNLLNHLEYVEYEVIEIDGKKEKIEVEYQAYYSLIENNKNKYFHVNDIMSNKDYRKQVIDEGIKELKAWCFRYKQFEELKLIYDKIIKFIN